MDPVLSPLTVHDAGEVLTLQRAAYASEAQVYGDPFLPALTQTLPELQQELEAGDGFALRLGSRLVGAVRMTRHPGELHIGRLTIAPDLQGRGFGTMLLDAAERSGGAGWAVLFTGHLSEGNLRLYGRRGYEETHRTSLTPEVQLVFLRKRLG